MNIDNPDAHARITSVLLTSVLLTSVLLTSVLIVVTLVALLALAGRGDLAEAERLQREYCTNVHAGHWPDYNHNYEELCDDRGNAKL